MSLNWTRDGVPLSSTLGGEQFQRLYALAHLCRRSPTEMRVATNLALDPELLDRVLELSGKPTKKAAVTLALREFIARGEQRKVTEIFGKLEWDSKYDYKSERSRS